MSSQLSDLRIEVRDRARVDSSHPLLDDTRVDRYINDALRQYVISDQDFVWLRTDTTIATTGVLEYALPADLMRVKWVFNTATGEPLQRATEQEIHRYSTTTAGGSPQIYAIEFRTIGIAPITTGETVQVEYFQIETVLSLDTDTALIPTEYEEGVLLYAAHLCNKALKHADDAAMNMAEYNAWLRRVDKLNNEDRTPLSKRLTPNSPNRAL